MIALSGVLWLACTLPVGLAPAGAQEERWRPWDPSHPPHPGHEVLSAVDSVRVDAVDSTGAALASPGVTPDPSRVALPAPPEARADTTIAPPPARGGSAPSWVMARSLVIPGWGQAKNGAWFKAFLVAGVEAALLERGLFESRLRDDFRTKAARYPEGTSEQARFAWKSEKHRRHRRDFTWWTGLWILLAMGDAYVDAHLKGFSVRLEAAGAPGEEAGGETAAGLPGVHLGVHLGR